MLSQNKELLKIQDKIKELESNLSDTKMQRNKAISEDSSQSLIDYYNNEIEIIEHNIAFWQKKEKELRSEILTDKEYKEKSTELKYYSIEQRTQKMELERLEMYINTKVKEVIIENLNKYNNPIKLTIQTLKKSCIIDDFYYNYKIDYDNNVIDVYVDFMEFSKLYLKVVKEFENIYKQDIEDEKQESRHRQSTSTKKPSTNFDLYEAVYPSKKIKKSSNSYSKACLIASGALKYLTRKWK